MLSPPDERHESDAGAGRHVAAGRRRAGCLPRGIGDGDDADGHGERASGSAGSMRRRSADRRSRVARACRARHRRRRHRRHLHEHRIRRRRCGCTPIAPRSAGSTIAAARWRYWPHWRCTSSIDVTLMRMPTPSDEQTFDKHGVVQQRGRTRIHAQQLDGLRAGRRRGQRPLLVGRGRISRVVTCGSRAAR